MPSCSSSAASGAKNSISSATRPPPPLSRSATASPAAEDHSPSGPLSDPGDRACDRGGDGRSKNVVVANVRKFVRDHAFEFVVVHQFHQALRHGHRSVARIAAGRKSIRRGLRNQIKLRHRQIRFRGQPLHHGVKPRRFFPADWDARRSTPAQSCPKKNKRRRS